MSEPSVSVAEVSGHVGVAKDTINRWIETRQPPEHSVGRLWKLKLSEVDPWVERGGVDRGRVASQPNRRRP